MKLKSTLFAATAALALMTAANAATPTPGHDWTGPRIEIGALCGTGNLTENDVYTGGSYNSSAGVNGCMADFGVSVLTYVGGSNWLVGLRGSDAPLGGIGRTDKDTGWSENRSVDSMITANAVVARPFTFLGWNWLADVNGGFVLAGYSDVYKSSSYGDTSSASAKGWDVGAGVTLALADTFEARLGYNYVDLTRSNDHGSSTYAGTTDSWRYTSGGNAHVGRVTLLWRPF